MSEPTLRLISETPALADSLLAQVERLREDNEALTDRVAELEDLVHRLQATGRVLVHNAPAGEDYACAALGVLVAMADKGLSSV